MMCTRVSPQVDWLFVLNEKDAAEWVVSNRRMGFREGVGSERLRVGDSVAIYITRSAFHNPSRDEAQIAAIGAIRSSTVRRRVVVAGTPYPLSCGLRLALALPLREGVPFKPLVHRLSFIRKPR